MYYCDIFRVLFMVWLNSEYKLIPKIPDTRTCWCLWFWPVGRPSFTRNALSPHPCFTNCHISLVLCFIPSCNHLKLSASKPQYLWFLIFSSSYNVLGDPEDSDSNVCSYFIPCLDHYFSKAYNVLTPFTGKKINRDFLNGISTDLRSLSPILWKIFQLSMLSPQRSFCFRADKLYFQVIFVVKIQN